MDSEKSDDQLIADYSKKTIPELKKLLVSFNPKAKKSGKKEDLISRIIDASKQGENGENGGVLVVANTESEADEVNHQDRPKTVKAIKEPNKGNNDGVVDKQDNFATGQDVVKPGVMEKQEDVVKPVFRETQDVIKSVGTHQKSIADQSVKIKKRKKGKGEKSVVEGVIEGVSKSGDGENISVHGSVSVGLDERKEVSELSSGSRPPKRNSDENEGGSSPYLDPLTGIYSYTAPYQLLKGNTVGLSKMDESKDVGNKINRKRKSEMNKKGKLKMIKSMSNESEKIRKRQLKFGRYVYVDVDNGEEFINITEDTESYGNRSGPYISGQILPNIQAPKSYCAKIFGPQTKLSNSEMAHCLKMNSDRAFNKQKSQECAPGSKAIRKMDPTWISKGPGDSDRKEGRPKYSTEKVQHFSVKSGDAFSYAFPDQVHVIMASATKRLYDTVKSQTGKNAADSLVGKMAHAASLSIANLPDGIDRAILTGTLSGAKVANIDIGEVMKMEDSETDDEDSSFEKQEEEDDGDDKEGGAGGEGGDGKGDQSS